MQLSNPFAGAGWVARIATGLWFLAYALTAVIAVPAGFLQVVALIAAVAWLVSV